jgi:RsiW-degrading membrane proteinase PrsW (M82 family)
MHTGVAAASILLSMVPLTFILLCVHTTQRCRPEPRASKRWALAWGAFIATGLASYANSLIGTEYNFSAVVVFAPILEEMAKALGLLLIFRRGHIKNALDGAVYSLLIGGGFAAVENVFYFADAFNDDLSGRDPGVVLAVFVARGIVSPFAHPLFTAMCGIALGMAYGKRRLDLLPLAGLMVGVLAHGLWNYGAITGALSRYPLGAFVVFAAAAVWVLFSVARERSLYRRHLPDLPDALRAELKPLTVRGLSGYEIGQIEKRRREAFRQAVLWTPGDSAGLASSLTWDAPAITDYQPGPTTNTPWSEPAPWYDRPPDRLGTADVTRRRPDHSTE